MRTVAPWASGPVCIRPFRIARTAHRPQGVSHCLRSGFRLSSIQQTETQTGSHYHYGMDHFNNTVEHSTLVVVPHKFCLTFCGQGKRKPSLNRGSFLHYSVNDNKGTIFFINNSANFNDSDTWIIKASFLPHLPPFSHISVHSTF